MAAWSSAWGSGAWSVAWGEDPVTGEPAEDDTTTANDEATFTVSNYLICDRTGFKVTVTVGLKKEWDGTMVRPESYTPRQPLDFIRPQPVEQLEGSIRPESTDWDIDTRFPSGVSLDDLDP